MWRKPWWPWPSRRNPNVLLVILVTGASKSHMLTDLRKAALFAGTAMGLRVLWNLAEIMWSAFAPGAQIRGGDAATLVGMQLVYVPLPLVFLLLYTSGIAL